MTGLLVALGAFLGAPLRHFAGFHLDHAERPGAWPTGTMLVNVLGSFLLGWASALALSGDEMAFLGVGFCGAFTTYSTFAVQAVRLGPARGTTYAVATLASCLAACALGFLL